MAKKKPGAFKVAAAAKAASKKPNPFELKKTRTKFETVGRRIKGTTKNVVQAREEATKKRKQTLLVEYKQLRKANTFVDRRFGEGNPALSEDDRGLARLQAQRLRQEKRALKAAAGKGGKQQRFVLGGDDGEGGGDEGGGLGLTHLGRSLADMEDLGEAPPSLDELDDEMVDDLVRLYNFGGGAPEAEGGEEGAAAAGGADGAPGRPKTRKQIMEEIIAKSKMYKALKARQREEDEAEMNKLDEEYKALVKGHALQRLIKPVGYMKGVKVKPDNEGDAAYDTAARMLAMEARAAPGERTLSPEELAAKEAARLAALEKERVRRMRGDYEGGDADPGLAPLSTGTEPQGGYAARRKRLREQEASESGDEEGTDEGAEDGSGSEDEEGYEEEDGNEQGGRKRHKAEGGSEEGGDAELAAMLSRLEQRRRERAAGDHPLQERFRAVAAKVLGKYGVDSHNPLVKEKSEGSDEDEDEDEEGEDEEGEEGEGGESEGEEEGEGEGSEEGVDADGSAHPSSEAMEEGEEEEQEVSEEEEEVKKHSKQEQQGVASAVEAELEGPLDLPFTIPVPETYEAFAALVRGRPAEHLVLAVQRIRAYNAAVLASESKKKLQLFYGILVQHFALLAGEDPLPLGHLDALAPILLGMTGEVPFYAATVARTRLKRMHERLGAASTAAAGGGPGSPWPTSRTLAQLRLFTLLFPVSDRRHPVITPLALLVSKYLATCTATHTGEVATALLLCGMALHMARPAKRFTPEPLNFLVDLLRAAAPSSTSSSTKGGAPPPRVLPELLLPSSRGSQLSQLTPSPPSLHSTLQQAGKPASEAEQQGDAQKLGLLQAGLAMLRRAISFVEGAPFAEAALAPAISALPALVSKVAAAPPGAEANGVKQGKSKSGKQQAASGAWSAVDLPPALREECSSLLSHLQQLSRACVAERAPLVQQGRLQVQPIKEFNPRFEEDGFSLGRDYDPDRVRAEQRKLKRQLQKERRGAVRELRRDAAFMASARDAERAVVDAERMESQRRFYSELQAQQADLKSGGQGGMNPHLKGKKGPRKNKANI